MNEDLQKTERDVSGLPEEPTLQLVEQLKADRLRAEAIETACHDVNLQNISPGCLNADMPRRANFTSLQERLLAVSCPTAMVGEIELAATSKVIKLL